MLRPDDSTATEIFISVDVETSGPIPGEYSLLQIGACAVDRDIAPFRCYLKPTSAKAVPEALRVTGLSLSRLQDVGLEPEQAMSSFSAWINGVARTGEVPVFVGFNAPFDWSFINYYFHRFSGENPFGISGVDIKAMYLGVARCRWDETRADKIAEELGVEGRGDHDALNDAMFQAELFRRLRSY